MMKFGSTPGLVLSVVLLGAPALAQQGAGNAKAALYNTALEFKDIEAMIAA